MDGNPIEKEASATFREEWGEKLLFRHCWVTKNLHTTTIITPLCAAQGRRKVEMFGGPVLIAFSGLESWTVHLYIDFGKLWGRAAAPLPPPQFRRPCCRSAARSSLNKSKLSWQFSNTNSLAVNLAVCDAKPLC